MGSLRLSQSPMEVELRLDQKEAIYTSRDTVSGEVVLHTESPADLSTIVLTLSATATSRLTKSRRTETHTVCLIVLNQRIHAHLIIPTLAIQKVPATIPFRPIAQTIKPLQCDDRGRKSYSPILYYGQYLNRPPFDYPSLTCTL